MMTQLFIELLLIFLTIPFIILVIITLWLYRDAKNRDMNAYIWILVLWLIPFFIGIIIYLKVREEYSNITI